MTASNQGIDYGLMLNDDDEAALEEAQGVTLASINAVKKQTAKRLKTERKANRQLLKRMQKLNKTTGAATTAVGVSSLRVGKSQIDEATYDDCMTTLKNARELQQSPSGIQQGTVAFATSAPRFPVCAIASDP